MKRALCTALALLALVTLTGCKEQSTSTNVSGFFAATVALPDGRTVVCVSLEQGVKGAISCDWDTAR